jgi:hypothetical protein
MADSKVGPRNTNRALVERIALRQFATQCPG